MIENNLKLDISELIKNGMPADHLCKLLKRSQRRKIISIEILPPDEKFMEDFQTEIDSRKTDNPVFIRPPFEPLSYGAIEITFTKDDTGQNPTNQMRVPIHPACFLK